MLPFDLQIRPGTPIHDQVVYAVKRAILGGALCPGDRFPSIRKLGRELGINPNTAQRIVSTLTADGFLEIRPGIGSVVLDGSRADPRERQRLLGRGLEQVVVEALRLELERDEVVEALDDHWQRLDTRPTDSDSPPDPDGENTSETKNLPEDAE